MPSPQEASRLADDVRRIVIEQSHRAGVGHIGSSLSIADLIAAVYSVASTDGGADRDRIVLSKGHAALALYGVLRATGRISQEHLDTFCGDGTTLGVHPEHAQDGIDFCTGSLGQGLSVAAGAALAAKKQGSERRIFVVMSDAELNEGSMWEAAMFCAQHRLDNLTLLIDLNGQQALGYTADVMDLGDVAEKLRVFGWEAASVGGHDHPALGAALAPPDGGRPRAIVARTTFGHGVSFMESEIKWHYLPLDEELNAQALGELERKAVAR